MQFPQGERDLRDKAQIALCEHLQACPGDSDCVPCKMLRRARNSAQAELDQELAKYYRQD